MTLPIEPHPEGSILPVRAHAAARRNDIGVVQAGMLRVSVTQAAEKGKANKAIQELLAKALDVRKSQIELLSGATSPHKRFLVRGLSPAELLAKVAARQTSH